MAVTVRLNDSEQERLRRVAYTILFVATAQQREYLHLIHIDKYPNA
ncbi:hypothetical protein HCY58_13730 [Acinetobacter radioresistens]|nr:hypothetical protein [Acinetobacter radioresistens]MCK4088103.1 hypothetical protein [Acinetobacter radioresistens]